MCLLVKMCFTLGEVIVPVLCARHWLHHLKLPVTCRLTSQRSRGVEHGACERVLIHLWSDGLMLSRRVPPSYIAWHSPLAPSPIHLNTHITTKAPPPSSLSPACLSTFFLLLQLPFPMRGQNSTQSDFRSPLTDLKALQRLRGWDRGRLTERQEDGWADWGSNRDADGDLPVWLSPEEHYLPQSGQSSGLDKVWVSRPSNGQTHMIKVYDLAAHRNAAIPMAPRKYNIQTGYYSSRLRTVRAQKQPDDKWDGKVAVSPLAYFHLSLSISWPFSRFLCHLLFNSRDALIIRRWHFTWVMAKGVWAVKQLHQSPRSFIMVTGQMVADTIKCGSLRILMQGGRSH